MQYDAVWCAIIKFIIAFQMIAYPSVSQLAIKTSPTVPLSFNRTPVKRASQTENDSERGSLRSASQTVAGNP